MSPEILHKAAKIKLAIFDVDGVLTDGRIYFGNESFEAKGFHIHDGFGMKLLQKSGITVAIITSHQSAAVERRMKLLGIQHLYQGVENKKIPFEALLTELDLSPEQVAYVGDDWVDLALINRSGLGIAVANAVPEIKQAADWVTETRGGFGAAREACMLILQAQNTYQSALELYR